MKLYDYPKSSAAYRVRIALSLKGIDAENIQVNLLEGEQKSSEYKVVNPQGFVPALETEQGILSQSLSILEYLEDKYPEKPLLPKNDWSKAQVRRMAYTIACDIHPLNNLRILKYLSNDLGVSDEQKNSWYAQWIHEGFKALETLVGDEGFCFGNQPTIADVCLVPQMFNARRFNVDLSAYSKLVAIDENMLAIPEVSAVVPS